MPNLYGKLSSWPYIVAFGKYKLTWPVYCVFCRMTVIRRHRKTCIKLNLSEVITANSSNKTQNDIYSDYRYVVKL